MRASPAIQSMGCSLPHQPLQVGVVEQFGDQQAEGGDHQPDEDEHQDGGEQIAIGAIHQALEPRNDMQQDHQVHQEEHQGPLADELQQTVVDEPRYSYRHHHPTEADDDERHERDVGDMEHLLEIRDVGPDEEARQRQNHIGYGGHPDVALVGQEIPQMMADINE